MYEPKIDDEVQSLEPFEAFEWLLDRFKSYMRNEIIWVDVRSIFLNAELLKSKFHDINTPSEDTKNDGSDPNPIVHIEP